MSNGNGATSGKMVLESNSVRLSLAVYLRDSFSRLQPVGRAGVEILELKKRSLINPSHYHIFFDLPAGDYHLQARAENYFDRDFGPVSIGPEGLEEPVLIDLLPRPDYPFPPGETLVRGILRDSNNNPITDAILSGMNGRLMARTTDKGEFVLYFPGLTEEDIILETASGKKYVKGDPDKTLKLTVQSGNAISVLNITEVEVGRTTSINLTIS